jgi:hypothetical protein
MNALHGSTETDYTTKVDKVLENGTFNPQVDIPESSRDLGAPVRRLVDQSSVGSSLAAAYAVAGGA